LTSTLTSVLNKIFYTFFIAAFLLIPSQVFSAACATTWSANNGQAAWNSPGAYLLGDICEDGGNNYTCISVAWGNQASPTTVGTGPLGWNNAAACGANPPTLSATITAAGSITCITATSGGEVLTDGDGSGIALRGIIYSKVALPEVGDAGALVINDGTAIIGAFGLLTMTGLEVGETYFARAYAQNNSGDIGYSTGQITFSALGSPTIAATTKPSSITATTASSGGNVTSLGGCGITERGIVWGTTTNPTITVDTKVVDGVMTTGAFTSNITGLPGAATKIFIRSYVTVGGTEVNTVYGTETWMHCATAGTVVTDNPSVATCESMTFELKSKVAGNVGTVDPSLFPGGAATILQVGYLYGTSIAHVTASTTTSLVGSTINEVSIANTVASIAEGSKFTEVTGLTVGTPYHVKAYISSDNGIYYGSVKTLSTAAACPVWYSCTAFDTWSTDAACTSPAPSADGSSVPSNAIAYARHDWRATDMDNLIIDLDAEQYTEARPYRLVVQTGGYIYGKASMPAGTPGWPIGAQLEVQSGAQFGYASDMTYIATHSAAAGEQFWRASNNSGSIVTRGSFIVGLELAIGGEWCYTGSLANQAGPPGSYLGDAALPGPIIGINKYANGRCNGAMVLPVELLSFDAVIGDGDNVNLSWITGSEINNEFFDVQYSSDATTWKSLAIVQGAGNSFEVNSYYLLDSDNEMFTKKYYRLKQTDFNGQSSYSKMKIVTFDDQDGIVHAYADKNNINVYVNGLEDNVVIRVYNLDGQKVTTKEVVLETKESSIISVGRRTLSSGAYFIQVLNGSKSFSYKLLLN